MTIDELRTKFESETDRNAVVINQYTYPTEQYFNWLEQQLVKLFAIPDVVGQSEQLKAFMDFAEWYKNEYKQHIPLGAIKEYIKSL